MSNNDTTFRFTPNENPQTENKENIPQSTDNMQTILNAVLQTNEKQSNNLIEQKKVIESIHKEKNELAKQLEQLQQEFSNFKANYEQNPVQKFNDDVLDKIENLSLQVKQQQKLYKEQQLIPFIEQIKQLGVHQNDVVSLFEAIKEDYGVDLANNPNLRLVQIYLQEQGYTNTTPLNGGYSYSQNNQEPLNNAYEEYINNEANKRIEKHQEYLEQKRQQEFKKRFNR